MKSPNNLAHRLILIMLSFNLVSCQEHVPSVSGVGPVKSQAYYAAHVQEATVIAKKCRAFEADGFTALGPSKQAAWLETADGINCKNAIGAYGMEIMNARARRMQEADARREREADARIEAAAAAKRNQSTSTAIRQ